MIEPSIKQSTLLLPEIHIPPLHVPEIHIPPLHVREQPGGRDVVAEGSFSRATVAMDTDHTVRRGAADEWHTD